VYEVPVGFKWFVEGLLDENWALAARKAPALPLSVSTGASGRRTRTASCRRCCRRKSRHAPDEIRRALSRAHRGTGHLICRSHRCPGHPKQKAKLANSIAAVHITQLAGEPIEGILTEAPGNKAPIGGIKVISRGGWFAARPSGTENIYKIYAESFHDEAHLRRLIDEAQIIVDTALAGA